MQRGGDARWAYLLRKTKRRTKAVTREPRLAGERKPSSAKMSVANVIMSSCTPVGHKDE